MHLELQNERRKAVINDNTLQCFINRGIKKDAWRSAWPAVEIEDMRKLKRAAKRWLDKTVLPIVN